MTQTSEYIPAQEEHEKAFRIEKAADPKTLTAIRIREQACDDANLDHGAARLFCRLLDLALNPMLHQGKPGQVIIGQTKLGCLLNCDRRTIRRWITQLEALNYVWISDVPMPNMKPTHCYHICAFQAPKQVKEVIPGGGLIGNGKRRFDAGFTRVGNAAAGRGSGHQRPMGGGLLDPFGRPVSSILLAKSSGNGQESPLSADKYDRWEGTPVSSGSGHGCPLTEDTDVLSQRSRMSAGSGQICPLTPDEDVRHKESQKEPERGFKSRRGEGAELPPPPQAARGGKITRQELLESARKDGWGADLEEFEARARDMFNSDRRDLEKELRGRLESAQGQPRKDAIKARLAILRKIRLGDLPEDEAPAPPPTAKPRAKVEISEAQLLQDAMGMIEAAQEAGIKPLLTPAHRAALKKAGVKA